MAKKRSELPPPLVPPCMLFCDSVILEQGTGKTTLVGTYSGLAATTFPSPPRDLHVYVQLTSFQGEAAVKLVCLRVDLPEPEEVYASQYTMRFRGKLLVEQLHLRLESIPIPGS